MSGNGNDDGGDDDAFTLAFVYTFDVNSLPNL